MSSCEPPTADATPHVTVVVVVYAQARFVEQCLDSVRAQTCRPRLVVVDDASPDDSADVVRRWAERTGFPVELVAHAENRGLGASLAEALDLVTTPFLAYIAGDDWMEPERVEVQHRAMEEAGDRCALSYSDVHRADESGVRLHPTFAQQHAADWGSREPDVYAALLRRNWIPAPSTMLRTSALRSVGGYDPEIFYEDHDVALRIARRYEVLALESCLATHRELTGSYGHRMFFTDAQRSAWLRARVLIYRKHLGHDESTDAVIVPMLLAWLRELYLRGEPVAWVRARYAEVRRAGPRPGTGGKVLALSRLGVPGRLVTSASSVLTGRR
ncbi:glycosyltransferase family 2 protein [Phycicoccus flavus]|uniref:glycosyltransferase family 2 protein n=1 Tax=Phycicoccus flavus TaxID=2502783 RepID=UPI000FEBE633|nr:glycosyltransferase [Phycicoccus flavus]NHA70284.1 glycosyltransferase [Phycicoccus flavus]